MPVGEVGSLGWHPTNRMVVRKREHAMIVFLIVCFFMVESFL